MATTFFMSSNIHMVLQSIFWPLISTPSPTSPQSSDSPLISSWVKKKTTYLLPLLLYILSNILLTYGFHQDILPIQILGFAPSFIALHYFSSLKQSTYTCYQPICIDTGASTRISNRKEDFINLTSTSNTVLKGISSGLQIEGSGTVCWNITTDDGNDISLHIHNSFTFWLRPCACWVHSLSCNKPNSKQWFPYSSTKRNLYF